MEVKYLSTKLSDFTSTLNTLWHFWNHKFLYVYTTEHINNIRAAWFVRKWIYN